MKLSNAEWEIMKALWARHPATAREIGTGLPSGVNWAYTTIKTMLTRLVEKKAVKEHKVGNTSVYDPVLTRKKARRKALQTLADQAFDGAFGPLVHFLVEEQNLSDKQRHELVQFMRENGRHKEAGK